MKEVFVHLRRRKEPWRARAPLREEKKKDREELEKMTGEKRELTGASTWIGSTVRVMQGCKRKEDRPIRERKRRREVYSSKLCRLGFFSAFYRVGFRSPCFWNAHSRW
ncbi:hypothetical protein LR48_Vigan284s002000 [Vigna angularis]|uniref:Uncharacterized protein n=1 Tax=Phaseolus angularis TaxID=3914 RepID=A0A0L9T8W0_PHAAN|nr:hypothetical protein LR48_Vigan284s002000 [Vigna angularis]